MPPIVAIGASAGGLEALRSLLVAMPPRSGLAFILVMHLDPTHKSAMVELLARVTQMPVAAAVDGALVEPDHVYVISPATVLRLSDGRLRVGPAGPRGVAPLAVDALFESVAAEQGRRCAAVVLSGMGRDGTHGVQAVRRAGGFVLVQTPESAGAAGMPESAILGDHPNRILAPEAMPAALMSYFKHRTGHADPLPARSQAGIQAIEQELLARTGHDFSRYKRGTIQRRVQRRMDLRRLTDPVEYAALVRSDAQEAAALFHDLLVGVTEFFREPASWSALQDLVIDPLLQRRQEGSTIRIWVPGCASGQEAYSIAILLTERMEALKKPGEVKIFATDINDSALEMARAGVFSGEQIHKLTPARRRRFFLAGEGGTWNIAKPIRSMVVFAQQSLISDPPFSRLDLISCRNVLIYLDQDVQQRVIDLFCNALRVGGFLFLGNTESVGQLGSPLATLSRKWRIYQRTGPARRTAFALPVSLLDPRRARETAPAPREMPLSRLAGLAQRLVLEQFSPASVLVDEHGQVLYYFGPTGEYLSNPTGAPTSGLIELVRPALRAKLRAALQKAVKSRHTVTVSRIPMRGGKSKRGVNIRITFVADGGQGAPLFLVVFEDQSLAARRRPFGRHELRVEEESSIRRLEEDLKSTRADLQAHVEELVTSNEEVKSANEEAMSMNEELQSSNEELETSKEELQSLNEELTTVNTQLQSKVEEVEATNNDLENLLASTELATIFLDRQFNIRRFTPAIRHLVSLMPGDIGRPFTDFAQRVSDDRLLSDARHVLESLTPIAAEVRDQRGRIYLRRILPYRTDQDRIEGVVITFADITDRRAIAAEQALAAIVASSSDAIISMDLDGTITSWNAAAESLYGYKSAQAVGRSITIIVPPDRREEEMGFLASLSRGQAVLNAETTRIAADGTAIDVSLSISPMRDERGVIIGASKIARDIRDRKTADAHQRLLFAELDHRVKNTLAIVMSVAAQTRAQCTSLDQFGDIFEGRILAMRRAHGLLSQSRWKGGSLRELIGATLGPIDSHYSMEGADLLLPPRAAVALAIVFHELATNATKYGALSAKAHDGMVRVTWLVSQEKNDVVLNCSWVESGGPPVEADGAPSVGTRLIKSCIEDELRGSVKSQLKATGLEFTMRAVWPATGGGT